MKELYIKYFTKKGKCILEEPARAIENDYKEGILFEEIKQETIEKSDSDPKLKKAVRATINIQPDDVGSLWYFPNRGY